MNKRALLAVLLATAGGGLGLATHVSDRPVESLKERWAPPPSTFLSVDGLQVHLRDEGPREDPLPVVLVHGTSASLHTWEGWVAQLRGKRRVITFDLPGFGLTGPNAVGDYRGDSYARFLLSLMDALHVQRFVVGGNSLGGEIAWRTAGLAPARVDRLILVDAAGPPFVPKSIPIGFVLARIPGLRGLVEWGLPRGMVEQSVRSVYGDPSKVTPALVDRYYELTLRAGNRGAVGQRFAQQIIGQDSERIAALKLPTLILWGGRDGLIPPAIAEVFKSSIAGSQLVMFDGLGHVPHEEDPIATFASVRTFLDAPSPGAVATGAQADGGTRTEAGR
jgi:pimeloyl-ACP methyl ester carboxylesterase